MRKLLTAFAIALPALSGAPAVAGPGPTLEQAEIRTERPSEAVPLGTRIQVQSQGAMAVTVRASDRTMPSRITDARVLVYDVEAEALHEPAAISEYDLNLTTSGGENLGVLSDIPGGLKFGLLEPGETRSGSVAFEVPAGQEPTGIVFATGNGYIQGVWAP